MKLVKVTVTGASDDTPIARLHELSAKFPWVEWGILLSPSKMGQGRYPSRVWLVDLFVAQGKNPLCLSGHICGKWAREVVAGRWPLWELPMTAPKPLFSIFSRFQLNVSPYVSQLGEQLTSLMAHQRDTNKFTQSWIIQMKSSCHPFILSARDLGLDVVPLFDRSGGKGELPAEWPKNNGFFTGFAGGLNPDNLSEQLQKIASVVDETPIWIDVETGVRTDDKFDLAKVERFLATAANFVSAD